MFKLFLKIINRVWIFNLLRKLLIKKINISFKIYINSWNKIPVLLIYLQKIDFEMYILKIKFIYQSNLFELKELKK